MPGKPIITATTRLVGLLGWPVSHSQSPRMHNAAYAALGLDWAYLPLLVPPEQVGAAVRGLPALGFAGANVTVPHKKAVMPFLDALTPAAQAIGAVNTIIVQAAGRLLGHNTDGAGFLADLSAHGIEPGRRAQTRVASVLVLGAGGAARGVVYALAAAGADITIVNRTAATAHELAATLRGVAAQAGGQVRAAEWPASAAVAEAAQLIVNTTSLGLHAGDPLPWDARVAFRNDQVAYDLIYNRPTEWLRLAAAHGARTIAGLGMLIHQGAHAAALWTDHDADALAQWMRKEIQGI